MTKPLTRWQNTKGTTIAIACIMIWIIGALITRNGDWPDKFFDGPGGWPG